MRNALIKNMEFYHVLNRGVDKRIIFLDKQDYLRFTHNLFEFNNDKRITNNSCLFRKENIDLRGRYRKRLVNIHAFCLMPNHYHLLLESKEEGGISKFMMKLNVGYAKYFNKKYKRSGTFFESRYKSILVEKEAHFVYLPYYIHFNPLDLKFPEWRDNKLRDYKKAVDFLNTYHWSSHLDYSGKRNFSLLIQKDFLSDFFGKSKGYKKDVREYLKNMKLSKLADLSLE